MRVTLMHNKFLSRSDKVIEDGEGSRAMSSIRARRFDATRIVEKFKDFHFGSFTVNEIHLSDLYLKAPNGYFKSTGAITF